MKTLLKGGTVINVFTGRAEQADVLIENEKILGVGSYTEADVTEDVSGKYICPGFIDGHIHIESTMMTPTELAKVALLHGTTAVVADPHEIANVCGESGIRYMLEASCGLPLTVYIMLPSCVPAGPFDEAGAVLNAEELRHFYSHERVLGLAEMMNYPGVLQGDKKVLQKLAEAKEDGKRIDGHAPLLSGADLDAYIAAGMSTEHECTSFEEATERIRKGQWVMIREGSAAKNLAGLIGLFDAPWCGRCLLVTDDRHPADFLTEGHIDSIIQKAVKLGKSPIRGIQMATLQAAQCFGLTDVGAIAPGYQADILVLDDLDSVCVRDVYVKGEKIVNHKTLRKIETPSIDPKLQASVQKSFTLSPLEKNAFHVESGEGPCRIIKTLPGQLLTEEWVTSLDFSQNNGVDTNRDILKIAVVERHHNTGHRGIGFISGVGLTKGAIASSVAHDSHNIVVVGTNDADMVSAVNQILAMGGGCVAVANGKPLAKLSLPIAGLLSEASASEIAKEHEKLEEVIRSMGSKGTAPLMTMAFMCLSVIPTLKITTRGLVDVPKQKIVPLFVHDRESY